jgi:hypothetical protein
MYPIAGTCHRKSNRQIAEKKWSSKNFVEKNIFSIFNLELFLSTVVIFELMTNSYGDHTLIIIALKITTNLQCPLFFGPKGDRCTQA